MAQSIVAIFKIKDGRQAAFEAAALEMVEAVNANEPGCLLYTLNRGDDPLTYAFMERYEDRAAVDAHHTTDHLAAFRNEIGGLVDGAATVMTMDELG